MEKKGGSCIYKQKEFKRSSSFPWEPHLLNLKKKEETPSKSFFSPQILFKMPKLKIGPRPHVLEPIEKNKLLLMNWIKKFFYPHPQIFLFGGKFWGHNKFEGEKKII